jgi:hypothetical protein
MLRIVLALLASAFASLAFAQAAVTDLKVGRNVVDREIVEETTSFAVGDRAHVWLRVEGAAGQSVTVNFNNGSNEYPVKLDIGGSPWRTTANKLLHTAGEWTVTVLDVGGKPLREVKLTVQ